MMMMMTMMMIIIIIIITIITIIVIVIIWRHGWSSQLYTQLKQLWNAEVMGLNPIQVHNCLLSCNVNQITTFRKLFSLVSMFGSPRVSYCT